MFGAGPPASVACPGFLIRKNKKRRLTALQYCFDLVSDLHERVILQHLSVQTTDPVNPGLLYEFGNTKAYTILANLKVPLKPAVITGQAQPASGQCPDNAQAAAPFSFSGFAC